MSQSKRKIICHHDLIALLTITEVDVKFLSQDNELLGMLTPQQAQDHPLKNQLLAAVGMQDALEPHTVRAAVALEDGDAFLLCTDGWWGALGDAEMADMRAGMSEEEYDREILAKWSSEQGTWFTAAEVSSQSTEADVDAR